MAFEHAGIKEELDFNVEVKTEVLVDPVENYSETNHTNRKRIAEANPYNTRRVTCHQLDLLWYFLHRNRDVATSYNRSITDKAHAKQKWREITAILNAQVDGARKDWASWCKYWVDFKSKLKRRVATKRASNVQGGPSTEKPLTEIEEKFLLILGDDFGLSAQGFRVEQPTENGAVHSQDSYESQPSILQNLVVEMNGIDSPQEFIPQVPLTSSPSRTSQSPPPENSSPRSVTLSPGPATISPGPETLSPGPARRSPRRRRRRREPPMSQEAARRALVHASQVRAQAAVRMSAAMENAVDVLRRIERLFSAAYQR